MRALSTAWILIFFSIQVKISDFGMSTQLVSCLGDMPRMQAYIFCAQICGRALRRAVHKSISLRW